jgi:FKBP-type peptidyl-prolyl cis-trans isomerase
VRPHRLTPASPEARSPVDSTGEERQVIIPGDEGYGANGFPAWGIPPNGTLDFTLEVLNIK